MIIIMITHSKTVELQKTYSGIDFDSQSRFSSKNVMEDFSTQKTDTQFLLKI